MGINSTPSAVNQEYWKTWELLKADCVFNFIVGMRSCGKTYGVIDLLIRNYFDHESLYIKCKSLDGKCVRDYMPFLQEFEPFAYLRKQKTNSLERPNVEPLFTKHDIETISGGQYNSVNYINGTVYPCLREEVNGKMSIIAQAERPICYTYSVKDAMTNKGADRSGFNRNFPRYVVYDEAIDYDYPKDLVGKFQNTCSTFLRNNWDHPIEAGVKIFLLANPVNPNCPFFDFLSIPPDLIDPNMKHRYAEKIPMTNNHYERLAFDTWFEFIPDADRIGKLDPTNISNLASKTSGFWEVKNFPHLPEYMEINDEAIDMHYEKDMDGNYILKMNSEKAHVQSFSTLIRSGYLIYQKRIVGFNLATYKGVKYLYWYPSAKYTQRINERYNGNMRALKAEDFDHIAASMLDEDRVPYFTLYPRPSKFAIIGFNTANHFKGLTKCIKECVQRKQVYYADDFCGMTVYNFMQDKELIK